MKRKVGFFYNVLVVFLFLLLTFSVVDYAFASPINENYEIEIENVGTIFVDINYDDNYINEPVQGYRLTFNEVVFNFLIENNFSFVYESSELNNYNNYLIDFWNDFGYVQDGINLVGHNFTLTVNNQVLFYFEKIGNEPPLFILNNYAIPNESLFGTSTDIVANVIDGVQETSTTVAPVVAFAGVPIAFLILTRLAWLIRRSTG